MFVFICVISILLIPSFSEAWGPLTHVYLGNEVLNLGLSVVPPGIYTLIKKYRNDFLYGNLSADVILGRRFQGKEKNTHNWDIAWNLFNDAKTKRQKAFAYGYLTHLSADTVVHNLRKSILPFKHSLLEVKSESLVDKKYRSLLKKVNKNIKNKHDLFLEDNLESVFFSFKTNKKLFESFLFLSKLPNYSPVSNFIDKRFPYEIPVIDIYNFQQESLKRMFELLKNGKGSDVLRKNPAKRSSIRSFKTSPLRIKPLFK